MSRPLSILMTIFLLFVPSLVSDRCTARRQIASAQSAATDCRTPVPVATAEPDPPSPRTNRRSPVWAASMNWVFVVQGVLISVADRVVLDRLREAGGTK